MTRDKTSGPPETNLSSVPRQESGRDPPRIKYGAGRSPLAGEGESLVKQFVPVLFQRSNCAMILPKWMA